MRNSRIAWTGKNYYIKLILDKLITHSPGTLEIALNANEYDVLCKSVSHYRAGDDIYYQGRLIKKHGR